MGAELRRKVVGVVVVAGVLAFGLAPAGAQTAPNVGPVHVNKTPIAVNPNLFKPDLAASLTYATAVVGTNGTITMHGKVCNEGNRNYVIPPAAPVDSEYMVYTRHPPKTYAQEQNLVLLGHKSIGTQLATHQCVTHDYALTVPGVLRWVGPGTVPVYIGPGERLAEKQIVFRLSRNYPDGSNFTASEDRSSDNNGVHYEIQYVEKAP